MTINEDAIKLYKAGITVTEIAKQQNRSIGNVSAAISKARKSNPDCKALQKKFNFATYCTNRDIKTGSIGPCIRKELSVEIQKWIINKTLEGKYDTISCFLTDLAGEAYFADQ